MKYLLLSFQKRSAKMSALKTFRIKRKLAKKGKQNRPIPQWIRYDISVASSGHVLIPVLPIMTTPAHIMPEKPTFKGNFRFPLDLVF